MPEGTAIAMLEAVKKLSPSRGKPVTNMWWTHRPNDMKPVAKRESTTALCPKIGRRAKAGRIVDTKPVAGDKKKNTTARQKKKKNRLKKKHSTPPTTSKNVGVLSRP